MFAFSRGACESHRASLPCARFLIIKTVIARAVAGLLHHMKALRPNIPNFDESFIEALHKYRGARDNSRLMENGVRTYAGVLYGANDSSLGLSIFVRRLLMFMLHCRESSDPVFFLHS